MSKTYYNRLDMVFNSTHPDLVEALNKFADPNDEMFVDSDNETGQTRTSLHLFDGVKGINIHYVEARTNELRDIGDQIGKIFGVAYSIFLILDSY